MKLEYNKVHGQTLLGVEAYGAQRLEDGSVVYDALFFELSRSCIFLHVTEDTDEIIIETVASKDDVRFGMGRSEAVIFRKHKGKPLGWLWTATNWRGYKDMIILSFDGPDPQFVFTSMANRLLCYTLVQER